MNDLERYFNQNSGRLIQKWHHYFEIYDKHFQKFRDKEVVVLEIGVSQGGSLQMWKEYFGSKAKIYGIDVNPNCKSLEEPNIEVLIGSQSDRHFLRDVIRRLPPIDILIDDGGHTMQQQIATFEELFDKIAPEGVYVCEDLHTSYQLAYGGGDRRRGTFIEYSKRLIDFLNAYHSEQRSLRVNTFTRSANSIHYYDSVVVIEKRGRAEPTVSSTGTPSFEYRLPPRSRARIAAGRLKFAALYSINAALRSLRLPGYKWR